MKPIKQLTVVAAIAAAFPISSYALDQQDTATPEEVAPVELTVYGDRPNALMTPQVILEGNELQNKLGGSLGATLANELGVSATGFGAGASRPVLRGLEGPRVQILENGLTLGDVSAISADHATGMPIDGTRQIEILRGAATFQYGSGSSGGLVNVINDRIAESVPNKTNASINTSYETATQDKAASLSLDTGTGPIALHLDTAINNSNNYKIPGYAELNGPNANWEINPGQPVNIPNSGKLPYSFNQANNIGLGGSYINGDGYTGASFEHLNHLYGTPTADGGYIFQQQNRYDLVKQMLSPFDGISSLKFSASYIQYQHTEYDATSTPQTIWNNKTGEVRMDLKHDPIWGMSGTTGIQVNIANLNATDVPTGNSAILPQTMTNSYSLFWIGQGRYGSVDTNVGVRASSVTANPNSSAVYAGEGEEGFVNGTATPPSLVSRQFFLFSYSAGALWNFIPQYGTGLTYTVSQRAPSTPELYAYGPHDATATFDVGNSSLSTETSHNLEFTFQKNVGDIQGKLNAYVNQFTNYIYGYYTGAYSSNNDNYSVVVSQQANARITGAEGELTYNWKKNGFGSRFFGDISEGVFNSGGYLPLQPAPRLGLELAHQHEKWLVGGSFIHGFEQNKLASFEIGPTPSYNLLNGNLSYTERINGYDWTAYLVMKNLLDQDIRYATTPMAVRLYAPQPGRSFMLGLKVNL